MARVLIRFRDIETWRLYDVGDEWEGPSERLDVLIQGGYVDGRPPTHQDPEDAADAISADMTVAQLREVAESRGIDVPKRATKKTLLELLEV
jgi:hypothetical protein